MLDLPLLEVGTKCQLPHDPARFPRNRATITLLFNAYNHLLQCETTFYKILNDDYS